MKALIIFNGIQFHYYHVDHAIDWAVKNNGELLGLFIHSNKEPREGYIFPSDIDPAENLYNKSDAEKSNEKVIHEQVKLFTDMAKGKNIPVYTEELLNPSLEDVVEITDRADILFVDADYDKAALLACTHFPLKKIVNHSTCTVEIVHDKRQ
jgi:hypothetical protein